jgi:hypothetical protein
VEGDALSCHWQFSSLPAGELAGNYYITRTAPSPRGRAFGQPLFQNSKTVTAFASPFSHKNKRRSTFIGIELRILDAVLY